jgi:hypothetical protein
MHVAWVAASFALANLCVAMFGDGTMDWAHWRFAWVMFVIGQGAACVSVCMAYYNDTASKEAADLAAAAPKDQPLATPDAGSQARAINGSPAKTPPVNAGAAAVAVMLIAALAMQGCAGSPAAAKVQAVAASPTTPAALQAVFDTAIDAASGQDVAAVFNGISAASLIVRSLQATPNAASPSAVSSAITTAGAPATVAGQAAAAISALTKAGESASAANEDVAEKLDAAAKALSAKPLACMGRMLRGLDWEIDFEPQLPPPPFILRFRNALRDDEDAPLPPAMIV